MVFELYLNGPMGYYGQWYLNGILCVFVNNPFHAVQWYLNGI